MSLPSENLLTSDLLSKTAVQYFKNAATFINTANREFENMWNDSTYKAGDSVNLRLDSRLGVQFGDTVTAQNLVDRQLPLTLNELISVPITYRPQDLKLKITDFGKNYLQPAVRTMMGTVNALIAQQADTQCYMYTGTPGTPINSFNAYQQPGLIMAEMGVPDDGTWSQALSIRDGGALRNSLANQFNVSINDKILKQNQLGHLAGFDAYYDQAIYTHTAGAAAGLNTIRVNGAVTTGTSIALDGITNNLTNAFVAGDKFTISGVYAVNPVTRYPTKRLMQFVIQANASSNGSGQATIVVSPAINSNTLDPNMNVSNAIPDNATVTVAATHNVNLAYNKSGLTFVAPQLERMDSPYSSVYRDPDTGLSLRISKTAEVLNNQNVMRLDLLWGSTFLPENVVVNMS